MWVLLTPSDIGGHAWGVRSALEEKNIKADVVYYAKSRWGFPSTRCYELDKYPKILRGFLKACHFIKYLNKYNVFHYINGKSLLPHYSELPILKLFNKKIFVTYNGSFSRLADFCISNFAYSQFSCNGKQRNYPIYAPEELKKKAHEFWNRYADQIFCLNPDLCHYSDKSIFIPYLKYVPEELLKARAKNKKRNKLKIAHAPTSTVVKGTDFIEDAIQNLRKKYHNFEYIRIENVQYTEAMSLISSCDVFIDQLLVGWYGGVAVEAMKMGIPVICYIREGDLKFVPDEMCQDMPIINANPYNIEEVISTILENPQSLNEKAEQVIQYANQYHSTKYLMSILSKYYLN